MSSKVHIKKIIQIKRSELVISPRVASSKSPKSPNKTLY